MSGGTSSRTSSSMAGRWPALFAEAPRASLAAWLALAVLLSVLPVGETIALRNVALLALLGLSGWALWTRRLRLYRPLLGPWLVYAGVALASLSYAVSPLYSLAEIRVEIVYPLLLFWVAASLLGSAAAWQRLLALLALVATFLIAFCLTTAIIGGSTKDGLIGTIFTGVGNFSTYLVTVAPLLALCAWQQWRSGQRPTGLALALLLVLATAAMYVTLNRQGFVALAVQLLVLVACLLWRGLSRRTATVAALALLLLAALGWLLLNQFERRLGLAGGGLLHMLQSDPRWPLWQFAADCIQARPWTGGGFGLQSFRLAYPDFAPGTMLWHAHNMFLNKGIQMGWPGMLAFLMLLLALPWQFVRQLRRRPEVAAVAIAGLAMLVGVYLKNMTDDFFMRGDAQLFWLLAGAMLGQWRREEG